MLRESFVLFVPIKGNPQQARNPRATPRVSMFTPASSKFPCKFWTFDCSISADKVQGLAQPQQASSGPPRVWLPKPAYLPTAAIFWSPTLPLLGAQPLFRSIKVPWARSLSLPSTDFFLCVDSNVFTIKRNSPMWGSLFGALKARLCGPVNSAFYSWVEHVIGNFFGAACSWILCY